MMKKLQNRPTWGKMKNLASASAKIFHLGASLRSTGIKVYSLGINTYSSDQNESILTLVLLTTTRFKSICH